MKDFKLLKNSFIFTVVYCLLFNIAIIYSKGFSYILSFGILRDILFVLMYNLMLFFGLMINRKLFCYFIFILFIITALDFYAIFLDNSWQLKGKLVSFNKNEIIIYKKFFHDFFNSLSYFLVLWLIFIIILVIYLINLYNQKLVYNFNKVIAFACLLFCVVLIKFEIVYIMRDYYPVKLFLAKDLTKNLVKGL